MNYDDLIRVFKTQTKIAKAVGLHQSTISLWKIARGGKIPPMYQLRLAAKKPGKLQPDAEVLEMIERARSRPRRRVTHEPVISAEIEKTPESA